MGSKKGMPHRKWSKEEKLKYILLHLEEHMSLLQIERSYGVSNSLVSAWVKRYLEDGEEALEPRHGNAYAALYTSKSLSEVERLRLIVAKQEVEIARLKKDTGGRSWCKQGICYWQRKDYEVIEELRVKYPVDRKESIAGRPAPRSPVYPYPLPQGSLQALGLPL